MIDVLLLVLVFLAGLCASAGDTRAVVNMPRKNHIKRNSIRYIKPPHKIIKSTLTHNHDDAVAGLMSLGYSRKDAISRVGDLPGTMSVAEMIKRGLNK